LSLRLVTEDDNVGFRRFGNDSTGSLGNTGVDTTTETTIGRSGNVKCLTTFSSLGFSIGEKSYIMLIIDKLV
jgi:hypothetical protein